MKLIEPSVTLIKQGYTREEIERHIEMCARTCYKSEDLYKGNSQQFVEGLIMRQHLAMLEHGTVYLTFPNPTFTVLSLFHERYCNNPYSDSRFVARTAYVTTNMRVLIENGWTEDLEYISQPTEYHHKRYTMKIVTDMGVARELCRHKLLCVA